MNGWNVVVIPIVLLCGIVIGICKDSWSPLLACQPLSRRWQVCSFSGSFVLGYCRHRYYHRAGQDVPAVLNGYIPDLPWGASLSYLLTMLIGLVLIAFMVATQVRARSLQRYNFKTTSPVVFGAQLVFTGTDSRWDRIMATYRRLLGLPSLLPRIGHTISCLQKRLAATSPLAATRKARSCQAWSWAGCFLVLLQVCLLRWRAPLHINAWLPPHLRRTWF